MLIRLFHRVFKVLLPDRRWESWLRWRGEREGAATEESGYSVWADDLFNAMTEPIDHSSPASAVVPLVFRPHCTCDECDEHILKNGVGQTIRLMHECAPDHECAYSATFSPICTAGF